MRGEAWQRKNVKKPKNLLNDLKKSRQSGRLKKQKNAA